MKFKDRLFKYIVKIIAFLSLSVMALIVLFIFKESIALFKSYPFFKFILGTEWKPLSNSPKLGILPVILGTIYLSFLALAMALPIALGGALFICFYVKDKNKKLIHSFIAILAGIPSIVYGFIGLLVVVKFMENHFSMTSGESLLAGAFVLAIMIIPYIISSCEESFSKVYGKYGNSSKALGVSKDYMIMKLILPAAKKSILAGTVLALGRAMGETMAVMMVIGNSPMMPKLLGKVQSIPSLIALEMGSAEVGSLHYYGLYGAGFVLMIILILINIIFQNFKNSID